MDWILFIAIAYSMVGVSLAGFISANKCRRYSHLHKCEKTADFFVKYLYLIWIVIFMQYM